MTVERAGKTEYAIRFYDINYKTNPRLLKPNGQFLFKTFSSYTNRESLVLPPYWNQMTGIKQWQLKPETIIFKYSSSTKIEKYRIHLSWRGTSNIYLPTLEL